MSLPDDPDRYGDVKHRDAAVRHLVQRATGPVSGRHFTLDMETGTVFNTVTMVSALETTTQTGHLSIYTKGSDSLLPSADHPVLDLSVHEAVFGSETVKILGSGDPDSYALEVGGNMHLSGHLYRNGAQVDLSPRPRLTLASGGPQASISVQSSGPEPSAFVGIPWHRCQDQGGGPAFEEMEWEDTAITLPVQGVYSYTLHAVLAPQTQSATLDLSLLVRRSHADASSFLQRQQMHTVAVTPGWTILSLTGTMTAWADSHVEFGLYCNEFISLGTTQVGTGVYLIMTRVG